MNIEQQRKAFDEWYGVKPKGWFEAVRYNTAWKAWLAAQQQEGYVMVPVEPTEEAERRMLRVFNESDRFLNCINIYKAMIEESQK